MDTKGAINFVECRLNHECSSEISRNWKGVIECLQRGEKYEAIMSEIEEFLESGVIMEIPEGIVGSRHIDIIKYTINEIKQKYFPEQFRRQFTLDFETEDVHVIRNIDATMKEFFSYGKFRSCGVKLGTYKGNLPKDFTEKVMEKIKEVKDDN